MMLHMDAFNLFWAAYPRRSAKGAARRAWATVPPLEVDAIMAGLEQAKLHNPQWRKDGGMYIPHPATWLRAEGWLDEFTITLPKLQPQRPAIIDRCEWPGCETYAVTSDIGGRNKRCSEHYHMKEVTQ